jgi:ABC-type polar amino acid transport system ATPase subunit
LRIVVAYPGLGQTDDDPRHQPVGHLKGTIVFDGIEFTHDLKKIGAVRRKVGTVFQKNCTHAPILVRKAPKNQCADPAIR